MDSTNSVFENNWMIKGANPKTAKETVNPTAKATKLTFFRKEIKALKSSFNSFEALGKIEWITIEGNILSTMEILSARLNSPNVVAEAKKLKITNAPLIEKWVAILDSKSSPVFFNKVKSCRNLGL